MRVKGNGILDIRASGDGITGTIVLANHGSSVLLSDPSKSPRPTVSIIVCTRHRNDVLAQCLESISRLQRGPNELVVVDNTTGDQDTKLLALQHNARYVVEPACGLSRARNRGWAETKSDIVAYVDDDAVVDSRWLDALLKPFDDPRVAVVTGETVGSAEQVDENRDLPSRQVSMEDPLWFEMATFGGLGFGTNMAMRRNSCPNGHPFDERLGRGAAIHIAEESYAFATLLARGYRAAHVYEAAVVHPEKPFRVEEEAAASFAYWLTLFADFPGHRLDLIRFLAKRVFRKRLSWPRDPRGAGEIISSGCLIYMKAAVAGMWLFLRSGSGRRQPKCDVPDHGAADKKSKP